MKGRTVIALEKFVNEEIIGVAKVVCIWLSGAYGNMMRNA